MQGWHLKVRFLKLLTSAFSPVLGVVKCTLIILLLRTLRQEDHGVQGQTEQHNTMLMLFVQCWGSNPC